MCHDINDERKQFRVLASGCLLHRRRIWYARSRSRIERKSQLSCYWNVWTNTHLWTVASNWNELTQWRQWRLTCAHWNTSTVESQREMWWSYSIFFFGRKWAGNVCTQFFLVFCHRSVVFTLRALLSPAREYMTAKIVRSIFRAHRENEKDRRMRMRHSSVSIYCDCTPTLRHGKMCVRAARGPANCEPRTVPSSTYPHHALSFSLNCVQ